jgi:small GTP-binding protein
MAGKMEIVLVGRSNVGKSSVIRGLTGMRIRTGRRPGVTRKISRYERGELVFVDMPGFGFMAGVSREVQERTKSEIVHYLEENRSKIALALHVIDVRSFCEIVERWEGRGQLPIDVEMFHFIRELKIPLILVANKIDLIYPEERDGVLDEICDKLGLLPPWRQWLDTVAPVSAKTGEGMAELKRLIKRKFQEMGKGRLCRHLR